MKDEMLVPTAVSIHLYGAWATQLPRPVMVILCYSFLQENNSKNMIFKGIKTKIITLTVSHNWYHKDNWQNKPFNLIIKTRKYFFL